MQFLSKFFQGNESARAIAKMTARVEKINSYEGVLSSVPTEQLPQKTADLKERFTRGESLDDLLPEAFALVRETSKRLLGERHYDVQLMGGIALHERSIAEMRTGEGKTLVATLPVYLNALSGKGVHVVTVNDYLSRRDAVWMGQIYAALGLSVGVINHDSSYLYDPAHKETPEEIATESFKIAYEFLRPCTRREAYAADITYGTNNEFGFDYLRDNIEYDLSTLRQREHHFAIVDEIDSILIDEARTPLIISAPAQESGDLYTTFSRIATTFKKDEDFTVDEKQHAIQVTEAGIEKAEKALGVGNIYTEAGMKYVHHLETAIKARALYERDQQYVVKDDTIVIVDEFTGRLQPGRRWSEGLHQAIEAKEGVAIQRESRTYASITFQNYFRMYEKLAGMTGTASTSAEEFRSVYNLDVITIPTHRQIARKDLNDLIFQTEHGKFTALARAVKDLHQKGQPVLLGTASIEKNEVLSGYLTREGIPHEVLNAKNHEREGEIIAQAGKKGKVTVATNMAGRGVDIKLGGVPVDKSAYEEIKGLGGLHVIGTERHEARRIDNQLRGRSGRQGDPGETQFYVSLEDSLMRIFASDAVKRMMGRFNIPEDEPISNGLISKSLESAQEKIEGFHFDSRKHVLSYDDVLNHQRKIIYGRRRDVLLGDREKIQAFLDEITEGADDERAQIEAKKKELGEDLFYGAARRVILQSIDMHWVEHLEAMEYLRGSVNLRAYGQRDPLIEYRKEGLRLFRSLEQSIYDQIIKAIPLLVAQPAQMSAEEKEMREVQKKAQLISASNGEGDGTAKPLPAKAAKTPGRNDPCPCGSGKKYKKCHGQNA